MIENIRILTRIKKYKNPSKLIISVYLREGVYSGANNRFLNLCEHDVASNFTFISESKIKRDNHFRIKRPKSIISRIIYLTIIQIIFRQSKIIFDSPFLIKNKNHFLLVHDPAGLFRNLRRNNLIKSKIFYLVLAFHKNFVVVSHYTKNVLLRILPKSKIIVSYNGTKKIEVIKKDKKRDIDFLILSSGEKHKRDYELLEIIKSSFSYNKIVLIGSKFGSLRNSKIDVFKNVTENELSNLYIRTKFYCSFSRIEGFGIPIIESLLHGCNLIISNIPVYEEIISKFPNKIKRMIHLLPVKIKSDSSERPTDLKYHEIELTLKEDFSWNFILKKLKIDLEKNK